MEKFSSLLKKKEIYHIQQLDNSSPAWTPVGIQHLNSPTQQSQLRPSFDQANIISVKLNPPQIFGNAYRSSSVQPPSRLPSPGRAQRQISPKRQQYDIIGMASSPLKRGQNKYEHEEEERSPIDNFDITGQTIPHANIPGGQLSPHFQTKQTKVLTAEAFLSKKMRSKAKSTVKTQDQSDKKRLESTKGSRTELTNEKRSQSNVKSSQKDLSDFKNMYILDGVTEVKTSARKNGEANAEQRLGFKTSYLVKFANKAMGKSGTTKNQQLSNAIKVRQYTSSSTNKQAQLTSIFKDRSPFSQQYGYQNNQTLNGDLTPLEDNATFSLQGQLPNGFWAQVPPLHLHQQQQYQTQQNFQTSQLMRDKLNQSYQQQIQRLKRRSIQTPQIELNKLNMGGQKYQPDQSSNAFNIRDGSTQIESSQISYRKANPQQMRERANQTTMTQFQQVRFDEQMIHLTSTPEQSHRLIISDRKHQQNRSFQQQHQQYSALSARKSTARDTSPTNEESSMYESEIYLLKEENRKMREINKQLLQELQRRQVIEKSQQRQSNTPSVGDQSVYVHNLYQQLYVSDMKKEREEVESELKAQRELATEAQMDVGELKRQNNQQAMIIKRYKKLVSELTAKLTHYEKHGTLPQTPQPQQSTTNSRENLATARKPSQENFHLQIPQQQFRSPVKNLHTSQYSTHTAARKHPSSINNHEALSHHNKAVFQHNQNNTQNTNTVSAYKLEQLSHLLHKILHSKRKAGALLAVLNDAPEIIHVQGLTLFILDSKSSDITSTRDQCYLQQMMFDGGWIERVAKSVKEVQDPCFKKPEELLVKGRIHTKAHLVLPLYGKEEGKLAIAVQFKLKDQHQLYHTHDARRVLISDSGSLNESSDEELMSDRPQDSTLSQVDEQMLQIIMHFLQIKLDKLTTDQDYAVARKEVLDSIKLATMICTQRSFSELFDNMRQFIPKFFGFQSVGILLKDQQTNELFTFVDTYDNKVQKSEKSKEANYKNIDPVNDVVTMKIPNSMGITGLVYKSDETFVCQNAQKEQRYQADVDNLGGNTNSVNNFIIGSIYGYPEEKGKKKIVGILQLVNKLTVEDPITEYDKKKFKAFQSLIGMAVDNTAEIYTTINVTLAVKQAFEGLRKYLDNITVGHDENNKNSTHITEHFMQINNQIRKLQSLKRQPLK